MKTEATGLAIRHSLCCVTIWLLQAVTTPKWQEKQVS